MLSMPSADKENFFDNLELLKLAVTSFIILTLHLI